MNYNKPKLKLFVDADDTILLSSEAIIQILNSKYNIVPAKTIEDLKDWHYRSIVKGLTLRDVMDLYESNDFFEKVCLDDDFVEFYTQHIYDIDLKIVTVGSPLNLDKKENFFKMNLDGARLIGIEAQYYNEFGEETPVSHDKSCVDMRDGIQIDDRIDCLRSSNAKLKILLKPREYHWNDITAYANIDNLYVVKNWKEAAAIIKFYMENEKEF